ncbi:MAG: DUF6152 family protein [Pseudomonadota bacterium]|nr:DUF6152 family protein [Pseudomonadota bacterium]
MRNIITLAMALVFASPGFAHHSDAGIDMESVMTLQGTIIELNWRNPHIYFTMESVDVSGEITEWEVQMGSTVTAARRGWERDSFSAGDEVTVLAHPARDGRRYAIRSRDAGSLAVEGEIIFSEPLYAAEVTAATSSLEGTWMANMSERVNYPGGFDGYFRAQLRLTEKGAAAQAAYDGISDENPHSRCIGRPTPAMIISTDLYALQIEINEEEEIVVIRSEFWDEERTVHMDGRAHPGDSERFAGGHSIGWWDEDALVVDTANFTDHRSPYQMGVPSGAQKHVVERYRLNEEGTRVIVEFTLEDPEYIAEPLTHTRELIYSPQIEISRYGCNVESARRFVPQ